MPSVGQTFEKELPEPTARKCIPGINPSLTASTKIVAISWFKEFLWIALLLPNANGPRGLFLHHNVSCVLDLMLISRIIDTRSNFVDQLLVVGFFL